MSKKRRTDRTSEAWRLPTESFFAVEHNDEWGYFPVTPPEWVVGFRKRMVKLRREWAERDARDAVFGYFPGRDG